MRIGFSLLSGVLALSLCPAVFAQAPAGAPAGATGQCNDGTYSMQASKRGACRGHQGIKQWFSADTATPAKGAAPAQSAAPATAATPSTAAAPPANAAPAMAASSGTKAAVAPKSTMHANTSTMAQAPGGGPGMVWLNTSTKVYHCQSDPRYGKTKAGKYVSEADAKAAGAHPARGKGCS